MGLYHFARCELDTERRLLKVADISQDLEPLVFDLLVFLLDRGDTVVSRDELIAELWNGRIISDSAISVRIVSTIPPEARGAPPSFNVPIPPRSMLSTIRSYGRLICAMISLVVSVICSVIGLARAVASVTGLNAPSTAAVSSAVALVAARKIRLLN